MTEYQVTAKSNGWTLSSMPDGSGAENSLYTTRAAAILSARDKLTSRQDKLLIQLHTGSMGTEEEYLAELWERNVCPTCEGIIPEGSRVGGGKKAQGGFCGLRCFARYYQKDIHIHAGLFYPS